MAESATYVFCLVQSDRAPSVKGAPPGLPGAGAARTIPVNRGLWAVVADAPLDRFSGEHLQEELQDIEAVSRHALAHASMIEFFFRRAPVIPLKLFTLFSADERVHRHLAARTTKLRKLFSELRGLEEWGVRIIGAAEPPSEQPLTSGRDYLEVKKRLQQESAEPSRATKQQVGAAMNALGRAAAKARKDTFPPPGRGRPYVAGSSFLVKATRRAQWKKQVAQVAASLAKQGHRLVLNGPWPPYHFVS